MLNYSFQEEIFLSFFLLNFLLSREWGIKGIEQEQRDRKGDLSGIEMQDVKSKRINKKVKLGEKKRRKCHVDSLYEHVYEINIEQ